MSRRMAPRAWLCSALAALAIAYAPIVAMAQPGPELAPPEVTRTEDTKFDPAAIEGRLGSVKLALDRIAASLQRDGLPVPILFDLAQSIGPVREQLDAAVAELEPRLGQLDAALKQVGPPPAAGQPAESATITAERARLQAEYSAVDAVLKQTRLLTTRADELADQVAQRRRSLYARQLLEQSPSVLSPFLWLDAARALVEEWEALRELLATSWTALRDRDLALRGALAALLLGAIAAALLALWRWWQRRVAAPLIAPSRFGKVLASIGLLVRIAVTAPLAALAALQVLEGFGLLSDRWVEIAYALAIAIAIAAVGRAVAVGVLAPDAPSRRLVGVDDDEARRIAAHFVWAARIMGMLLLALVVHRVLDAAPVLFVASNMLFALALCALLLHLLLSSHRARAAAEEVSAPRALWLRAIAWVVLTFALLALAAGYAGLAVFVVQRLLSTVTVLGVLYLLLMLTHVTLVEWLAVDTPRTRALAANIGVSPRRLGLLAALLSGGVCLILIVGALVLIVGPLELTPADFQDTLRRVLLGFRIGEINVSLGAVFAAALLLLLVLLVTKALQSWLERFILPRTELEPSLQQSIAAVFGYAGVIMAIVLAVAQLGIDLQKIALIAGALSVGIGFGLQSIVSNFISGLILLAERPIRVGDLVLVKGEEGYVRRIRVRATEIETFERASVIIPNAEFITGAVKNWTHANTTGRIIIKVGVGYDSDPEQVQAILLACADEHPRILKMPAPRALLLAFGDSALDFELRAYVDNVEVGLGTRSDLHLAILRRFRAAGIAIPYPQREVRLLREPGRSGEAMDSGSRGD
ncbi:MAG: mechanosensitive ion channel family protein [Hyphomicrobiales bacterium]|nr:mechanosensitive ion channel family protein [Hyphomicrobiales bacterium]